MTNLLKAILNISKQGDLSIANITEGNNRVNNMGEGLEVFVKDAFSCSFNEEDREKKKQKYREVFSYEGSKTTPPDLMLKNGDAIEVKKTESLSSELQLNSSHPKSKLYSSSSLISEACRSCEKWKEKDFIYVIGHVPKSTKNISSIWFVDGSIYAANEDVYLKAKEGITESILNTSEDNFSPTKEIGRLNSVDPLSITNLRIRGMWLLKPPFKVFDSFHGYSKEKIFQCFAIIPLDKYNSYPSEDRLSIEANNFIEVNKIELPDPNNPMVLIKSILIKYSN
jgi:hypothetical protein